MFSEKELVTIAKRENNTKRNYLLVNPSQGKHIPVSPKKTFELFDELADKVRKSYPDKKLFFIGFAETATAIGARIAITAGGKYIQTTREIIEDVSYLFFSEAHSHAMEQKLVAEDIDSYINEADVIVFVEDEVTTGNTIMNIIEIMEKRYDRKIKFSVVSILNGMNDEALKLYAERDIDLHFILKTCHDTYPELVKKYADNGIYNNKNTNATNYKETAIGGYINTRRICDSKHYAAACEALAKTIQEKIDFENDNNILLVGTEECMYPALFTGSLLEEKGFLVMSHSTTRSPISVSIDEGYPLMERFELVSLYDVTRRTFLYNIKKYDHVIIITDAVNDSDKKGIYSLVNALTKYNQCIDLVRWCN